MVYDHDDDQADGEECHDQELVLRLSESFGHFGMICISGVDEIKQIAASDKYNHHGDQHVNRRHYRWPRTTVNGTHDREGGIGDSVIAHEDDEGSAKTL